MRVVRICRAVQRREDTYARQRRIKAKGGANAANHLLGSGVDLNGNAVEVQYVSLDELMAQSPGLRRAIETMRSYGLGHIVDMVQDWGVTDSLVEWSGRAAISGGRRVLELSRDTLNNKASAEFVATHELGHIADFIHDRYNAEYSAELDWAVGRESNGDLVAYGDVAQEMLDYFSDTGGKSGFAEKLGYPLRRIDMAPEVVSQELFAQAFAAYLNPEMRAEIEANLPQLAAVMKDIIDGKAAQCTSLHCAALQIYDLLHC